MVWLQALHVFQSCKHSTSDIWGITEKANRLRNGGSFAGWSIEPQNRSIDEFYAAKKFQRRYFEALKLENTPSGGSQSAFSLPANAFKTLQQDPTDLFTISERSKSIVRRFWTNITSAINLKSVLKMQRDWWGKMHLGKKEKKGGAKNQRTGK